jgi:hypothetical protein
MDSAQHQSAFLLFGIKYIKWKIIDVATEKIWKNNSNIKTNH